MCLKVWLCYLFSLLIGESWVNLFSNIEFFVCGWPFGMSWGLYGFQFCGLVSGFIVITGESLFMQKNFAESLIFTTGYVILWKMGYFIKFVSIWKLFLWKDSEMVSNLKLCQYYKFINIKVFIMNNCDLLT